MIFMTSLVELLVAGEAIFLMRDLSKETGSNFLKFLDLQSNKSTLCIVYKQYITVLMQEPLLRASENRQRAKGTRAKLTKIRVTSA